MRILINQIISKDEFVKIMNKLKEVNDFQDDINDVFRRYNVDGYLHTPDCSNEVVLLLHIMFGDLDQYEWISYFVYDLEYGKTWEKGMVTDCVGNDIYLRTPEELYDFLLSNAK